MHWWIVALIANSVVSVSYLAIGTSIGRHLGDGGWRSNRLASATAAIFFSCAVGHGVHALHLLLPSFGYEAVAGNATRVGTGDWNGSLFDVVSGGIGVWYWTLRSRFPALVRGGAMFEDVRHRQRQALAIHDSVVQSIATAKLSLELGDRERGMAALDESLAASRAIITDLLGAPGSGIDLGPGDLRRLVTGPTVPGTAPSA